MWAIEGHALESRSLGVLFLMSRFTRSIGKMLPSPKMMRVQYFQRHAHLSLPPHHTRLPTSARSSATYIQSHTARLSRTPPATALVDRVLNSLLIASICAAVFPCVDAAVICRIALPVTYHSTVGQGGSDHKQRSNR